MWTLHTPSSQRSKDSEFELHVYRVTINGRILSTGSARLLNLDTHVLLFALATR